MIVPTPKGPRYACTNVGAGWLAATVTDRIALAGWHDRLRQRHISDSGDGYVVFYLDSVRQVLDLIIVSVEAGGAGHCE